MNQKAFLQELEKHLKHMPKEDREDALSYYREYFADMGVADEEDVSAAVGTPKEVARTILADCTEKQVERQKQDGGVKNGAKVIWLVLLGICASPIALPFILVLVVLFLCGIIILFSIVLCVVMTGFVTLAGGVAVLPGILWAAGIGQKLVLAGYAVLMIALGLLFFVATVKLSEYFIRFIAWLFRKCFAKKEVA